jgi:hypothetical protein
VACPSPCRAGDHPLARLTLQTPSNTLLQPGGTVAVLLDLRAAHGPLAPPPAAAAAGSGGGQAQQWQQQPRPQCLQVGVEWVWVGGCDGERGGARRARRPGLVWVMLDECVVRCSIRGLWECVWEDVVGGGGGGAREAGG